MREKVPNIMNFLKENDIDIMLVQETWVRKCDGHIIKQVKEYGFKFVSCRKSRKIDWGGGVAVIFKDNLKLNKIKSEPFKSFEHIICKLITSSGPLLFVNVYRAEYSEKNKFTVKDFLGDFSALLQNLSCDTIPCVIVGDFNIHMELLSTTAWLPAHRKVKKGDAEDFSMLLSNFGFVQLIDKPTHCFDGILDLLIVKDPSIVNTYEVGLPNVACLSDHGPIHINFQHIPTINSKMIEIKRRHLDSLDLVAFNEEMYKLEIPDKLLNSDDPCSSTSLLNSSVSSVLNQLCPIQTRMIKSRPKQRWYNQELQALKQTRRKLERRYCKHPSVQNKNEFTNMENVYKCAVRNTRSKYFANLIWSNKDDLKKLYKLFNELLDDDCKRPLPSCESDEKLANDMTQFFSEKIAKIRNQLPAPSQNQTFAMDRSPGSDIPELLNFTLINEDDMSKILGLMKKKVNIFDPVPISLVIRNSQFFIPLLTDLVNKSLQKGIFPDDLKHALVSPVYKPKYDDTEDNKGYRPVSNLPFLSKLIEKAALLQIQEHLDEHNLNPKSQSAYQKGHSCETALCKVVGDIQEMLADGKMVMLAILDMSAAFDTVDHDTLLGLLCQKYKINGHVLNWLTSYLKGRTFAVKIRYIKGRRCLMVYGVPQGSILGPLLFILYIDDIPRIAADFDVFSHSYADDVSLYTPFDPFYNFSVVSDNLVKCVEAIEVWMSRNFLKINVGKTEVLFIGKKQDHCFHHLSITIGEKVYSSSMSNSVESLGAYIDGTLSMEVMVSQCVQICNFNLRKIKGIKYSLDVDSRLMLVKSHILSKIDYCNILLSTLSQNQLQPIQRVLNCAMRFAYNLKGRDSVSQYLKNAHILPVKYRVMFKSCVMVFKILNGSSPEYLKDLVTVIPPNHRYLRSSNDLFRLSDSPFANCIRNSMILNWNNLPMDIRFSQTLSSFKKLLKTHYFRIAFEQ